MNDKIVQDVYPRIMELDALRGLTAFAVMLYHYTSRYSRLYGFQDTVPPFEFWYGHMGVEFFFMISGFVIFMTLNRTYAGMDFVISRFSRLAPAFWVAVLVTFISVSFFSLPGRQVSSHDALLNLTMLPRLLGAPMVDGVYWSLEKEILFYLTMFILFKMRLLPRVRQIFVAWIASAIALPFLARILGVENFVVFKATKELFLFKQIPFFAFGVVFYDRFNRGRFDRWGFLIIALGMMKVYSSYPVDGIMFATCYIIFFLLLIYGRMGVLSNPVLLFLGTISYPLYLIHQNIGYIVIRAVSPMINNSSLAVGAAIAVSLFLASSLTFLVERPARRVIRVAYRQLQLRQKRQETVGNG